MIYEVRRRRKQTDEPFEQLPKPNIGNDGETAARVAQNLTLMDQHYEYLAFATQVDDRTWVPVGVE